MDYEAQNVVELIRDKMLSLSCDHRSPTNAIANARLLFGRRQAYDIITYHSDPVAGPPYDSQLHTPAVASLIAYVGSSQYEGNMVRVYYTVLGVSSPLIHSVNGVMLGLHGVLKNEVAEHKASLGVGLQVQGAVVRD
jgi:hypothetical protein